jgi:hypothetical protein
MSIHRPLLTCSLDVGFSIPPCPPFRTRWVLHQTRRVRPRWWAYWSHIRGMYHALSICGLLLTCSTDVRFCSPPMSPLSNSMSSAPNTSSQAALVSVLKAYVRYVSRSIDLWAPPDVQHRCSFLQPPSQTSIWPSLWEQSVQQSSRASRRAKSRRCDSGSIGFLKAKSSLVI